MTVRKTEVDDKKNNQSLKQTVLPAQRGASLKHSKEIICWPLKIVSNWSKTENTEWNDRWWRSKSISIGNHISWVQNLGKLPVCTIPQMPIKW